MSLIVLLLPSSWSDNHNDNFNTERTILIKTVERMRKSERERWTGWVSASVCWSNIRSQNANLWCVWKKERENAPKERQKKTKKLEGGSEYVLQHLKRWKTYYYQIKGSYSNKPLTHTHTHTHAHTKTTPTKLLLLWACREFSIRPHLPITQISELET